MSSNKKPSKQNVVTMTISRALLEQMFRLDPRMSIVQAYSDPRTKDLVVFEIAAPNAPDNAVEMVPHYYNNGRPDPVSLTSVAWHLRDGSTAIQEFGIPVPTIPEPASERTAA